MSNPSVLQGGPLVLRAFFGAALVAGASIAVACGDDSSASSTTDATGSGAPGATSGGGDDATGTSSSPAGSTGSSSGNGGGSGSSTTTGSGSSTTGSSTTTSSTSTGSCQPDCTDRVCGDDGCGESCGSCDGSLVCSSAGQCISVDPDAMSFFVTSVGNGSGDFDGLAGADATCQALASAVGAGDRAWRAYLSTSSVDARDRIGAGPWVDATGELVASDVADLHASGLLHENALDENGEAVPNGKTNPGMNEHDVLTGSNQDGTFSGESCADWTSASPDDGATAGHCDASFTQTGGSSPTAPSDNWNSSHVTSGCDEDGLFGTGSTARIYCFAE